MLQTHPSQHDHTVGCHSYLAERAAGAQSIDKQQQQQQQSTALSHSIEHVHRAGMYSKLACCLLSANQKWHDCMWDSAQGVACLVREMLCCVMILFSLSSLSAVALSFLSCSIFRYSFNHSSSHCFSLAFSRSFSSCSKVKLSRFSWLSPCLSAVCLLVAVFAASCAAGGSAPSLPATSTDCSVVIDPVDGLLSFGICCPVTYTKKQSRFKKVSAAALQLTDTMITNTDATQ